MSDNHRYLPWHGISRDEISWWPLVESCHCDGCGLCATSCPTNALAFDYMLRVPFINRFHRCVVGCSVCAVVCPNGAFQLPDDEMVHRLIAERGLANRARFELRLYRKRLAGIMPQAGSVDTPGDFIQ